jgi:hypothetical protein
MGPAVFVMVVRYVIIDLLNPLLVPQEDAARVLDEVASKPIDLGLELFADLLEGFRVEGAAEGVVEERDEGRRVFG